MRAHGVMFHHFHGGQHPAGQDSLSAEQLARVIERVGRRHILPARQWMQCALTATLRPTDVCLTFDDNLRCQFDVALPVLRAFGLTAFWFVQSAVRQGNLELDPDSLVGKLWMGDKELSELHSAGHVVGLRSHTHPTRLEGLSVDAQRNEYGQNFQYLHNLLGCAPKAMSHPCNSYSRQTLSRQTLGIWRELGIVLGFRSNMQTPGSSELEYPREEPAHLLSAMAA